MIDRVFILSFDRVNASESIFERETIRKLMHFSKYYKNKFFMSLDTVIEEIEEIIIDDIQRIGDDGFITLDEIVCLGINAMVLTKLGDDFYYVFKGHDSYLDDETDEWVDREDVTVEIWFKITTLSLVKKEDE